LKFLVFTHVIHKYINGKYFGYGPYIKEMNIWFKYVDEVWIIAPLSMSNKPDPIDLSYIHPKIKFIQVPSFQITSLEYLPKTIWATFNILFKGFYFANKADHLHLRCPGNVGLLACLIQIFFPMKTKTAKYAGNWDRNASKPWSYRLQQNILNKSTCLREMARSE
jgi:hypothetical protein